VFTIATATGKTFDSDYAVDNSRLKIAFVRILDQDVATIKEILKNTEELPFDCLPQYKKVEDIFDDGSAVKIMLKQ
jgi:hypothetical protein